MSMTTKQKAEALRLQIEGWKKLGDVSLREEQILEILTDYLEEDFVQIGYIDPDSLREYRGRVCGGSWSPQERTFPYSQTMPVYVAKAKE